MSIEMDLEEQPKELAPSLMLTMVVQLWKQLLAHDEILNARNLLNSVPWQIRDRDEIKTMKAMVDGMLTHVDDPAVKAQIYESYGANEACGLTDQIPPHWSQIPRWAFAYTHVKTLCEKHHRRPKVLDIATSDGWIANRLGMMTRADVYGVDISTDSIKLALCRAEEHGTGVKFSRRAFPQDPLPKEWPLLYDVILLFEVYEHVADSTNLVKAAAQLLTPNGSLLVTCPRGSWCMGHQVSFHEKWNEVKPREHIRAPTPNDIITDCVAAGLTPLDAQVVPMPSPDVPDQAGILVRAAKQP